MREKILDELIQMDTWDWWKSLIYELRERKDYAEAEACLLYTSDAADE